MANGATKCPSMWTENNIHDKSAQVHNTHAAMHMPPCILQTQNLLLHNT